MLQAKNVAERTVPAYAIPGDFCRIFAEEMNSLYLLSYLLTLDSAKAEQCFVSGLEDCVEGNPVFKEWARSWARRAIVRNAIKMVRPATEHLPWSIAQMPGEPAATRSEIPLASVLRLKTFERFVFVMSALEGYSDQDCKILLGCSRGEVVRARVRAIEQIHKLEAASGSHAAFEGQKVSPGLAAIARTA